MYSTSEKIVFIDLEYGHVYGTYKRISIPTEIGIAFYDEKTNSVDYSGRKFTFDIDIEQWKNIIDKHGNKVSVSSSVANLEKKEYNKVLDKNFKLDSRQKKIAYKVAGKVYRSLNYFMNDIIEESNIEKTVFFGDHMEREAFRKAKINTKGFEWNDLQTEIKNEYNMEMFLSLDKVSRAIKFRSNKTHIKSLNFQYNTPDKYKYLIKPHKALGDSARIFLVYKEFNQDKNKFKRAIENHLAICKSSLHLNTDEST